MTRVALADLRESWPAWLGVLLAFVTTSFALAVSVLFLASASAAPDTVHLDPDNTSLLFFYVGTNIVLCVPVALAVIGASTKLVVASRRGAVARLLLGGAAPGQVTRLLSLQIAIVSLVSAVVGDLLALALVQPALNMVSRDRSLPHVPAQVDVGLLLGANLGCVALCVLGGLRQAHAASRIPPVEALRAANGAVSAPEGVVRRVLRALGLALCLAVIVGLFPLYSFFTTQVKEVKDELMTLMQIAMILVPLTGLALNVVLPWFAAPLVRAWTRVLPLPTPAWHLARHAAAGRGERLARSLTPIMFAVGLLSGLMCMSETMLVSVARVSPGTHLEGSTPQTLVSIMGLALAIAVAGAVGNIVMMSSQRSAELALDGVIGATPRQQLLVPVLEAVILTVTASALGIVMGLVSAGFMAFGLGKILPGSAIGVPYPTLLGTIGLCLVVVSLATVLPVVRSLRRPAPKVIAQLVAA